MDFRILFILSLLWFDVLPPTTSMYLHTAITAPVEDMKAMSIGKDALNSHTAESANTGLKGSMTSGLEHDVHPGVPLTLTDPTPPLLPKLKPQSLEEAQSSNRIILDRLNEQTKTFSDAYKNSASKAHEAVSELAATRTEVEFGSSISKLPKAVPKEIPGYRLDLKALRYLRRKLIEYRQKKAPKMLAKSMKLEKSLYESIILANLVTLGKAEQTGMKAIKLQKNAYNRIAAAHNAGLEPLKLELDNAYLSAEAELSNVRSILGQEGYNEVVKEMRQRALWGDPTVTVDDLDDGLEAVFWR